MGVCLSARFPSFHLSLTLEYLHLPPANNIKTANQMQNCLKLDTEKIYKTVKCHSSHLKLFFMVKL